jgi:dCMP deaminase
MAYALAAEKRSMDPYTRVGSAIVDRDHELVSTGFNGPPRTLRDELVPWGDRVKRRDWVIHAEENAMWFAVKARGLWLDGCTIFTTAFPCHSCVIRAVHLKVAAIVYGATQPAMCDSENESMVQDTIRMLRMDAPMFDLRRFDFERYHELEQS